LTEVVPEATPVLPPPNPDGVVYSVQIALGRGFARTAEVQANALLSAGLLANIYTGDSFAPEMPYRDIVFDAAVAAELRRGKLFHGWNNGSLASIMRAKELGMKTIVERQSAHATVQKRLTGAVDSFSERRMVLEYELADIILVPSNFVASSFYEYPELKPKVRKITLGVDITRFKRTASFKHPFRLLFIAQNFDRKGGVHLLKAWQSARRQSKTVRDGALWVVGEVPLGNLGQGVNALGWLDEDTFTRTIQESDALVLPSLEEGFGLVVLEAMAAGKPVILSENVGAKDCIGDGREGYIVPVGNHVALARAITAMANSSNRRLEMAEQAHRTACRYSWEKYVASYLELVKTLLQ